ncbi:SDR family oxidoreductase [Halobacillus shinanisalinarum]|uniref:SDR family oxidoreductase n=1 Tax=Halobacillus shinanisalinarum TaxID=2932258 RepID=A0ABY4GX64_9BACI|nr:SDR family oxidoreductase [Halobacillus shinanisalinarum]UOQ92659.1 SDR family oxidoreductase [Halobacillus shinanisalinarum]
MDKKVAIVTGANSGMGLATTIELAKYGSHVIMFCRNENRGAEALKIAKEKSRSDNLSLILCDLGSLESIRKATKEFKKHHQALDLLINNAGVVSIKKRVTQDGFESQLGVNHLGHFLLTNLLLDNLKAADEARVIVVSSGAHKWGKIYFNDPHFIKNYNVIKGYGQSKLANILFARALANKLEGTNITVNSLHPGAVATNLGVDRGTGFGKMIMKGLSSFFKTPLQGVETAIYLATSPEVKGISGEYYYNKKKAPTSKRGLDLDLAEKLWRWSEEQVHL